MKPVWIAVALATAGTCWCAAVGAVLSTSAPATAPIPTVTAAAHAPPWVALRREEELLTELRALEKRGRTLPRSDLARCGNVMREAQRNARDLRAEARAHGYRHAEEAAIYMTMCVSCAASAPRACADAREVLAP